MSEKDIIMNEKTLLSNARQYKKSSIRCAEQKVNNDGSFEMLLLPSIVLLSLSVELYLKYVLFKDGKTNKEGKNLNGHNLFDNLIKKLNPKHKNFLMQRTNILNDSKFNEYAKLHSDIFVKWRYSHEFTGEQLGTVNPSFLFGLCDALEFIIISNGYES